MLIEKPRRGALQSFKIVKGRRKQDRRGLLAGILVLTALFSLLPDFHPEKFLGMNYTRGFDMLIHGGYYFVATVSLFILLPFQKRSLSFFFFIYSISFLFDCIQLLIPGRSFTLFDLLSNLVGISFAFLLFNLKLRGKIKTGLTV